MSKQFTVYFLVRQKPERFKKTDGFEYFRMAFYRSEASFREATPSIVLDIPVELFAVANAVFVRDEAFWKLETFDELRAFLLHLYKLSFTEKMEYRNAVEFWRTATFLVDGASGGSRKYFRSIQLLSQKIVDIADIYRKIDPKISNQLTLGSQS